MTPSCARSRRVATEAEARTYLVGWVGRYVLVCGRVQLTELLLDPDTRPNIIAPARAVLTKLAAAGPTSDGPVREYGFARVHAAILVRAGPHPLRSSVCACLRLYLPAVLTVCGAAGTAGGCRQARRRAARSAVRKAGRVHGE
jgi:hypothetical protein